MNQRWSIYAALGAGGLCPRVEVIAPDLETAPAHKEFPPGGSVYALARSPKGTALAVGTKNGRAICYAPPDHEEGWEAERPLPHRFAPVLAMEFISETAVAVANAAGGCWLYDTGENQGSSNPLATCAQPICALCAVNDHLLAGLAADGHIALWDTRSLAVVGRWPGPPQFSCTALVTLTRLGESQKLLLSAANGEIATFDLSTEALQPALAHAGKSYAIIQGRDSILTLGKEDGVARIWTPELEVAATDIQCPVDVISGGWLDENEGRLLLVTMDGKAGIYAIEGDEIRCQQRLPGDDFRVFLPPDAAALEKRHRGEALAAGRETASRILSHIDKGNDTTDNLRELESLGFRHVALTLRAEEGERTGDSATVLHAFSELASMLPDAAPEGERSLVRYASLCRPRGTCSSGSAYSVGDSPRRLRLTPNAGA
jgi:hypothetical protein